MEDVIFNYFYLLHSTVQFPSFDDFVNPAHFNAQLLLPSFTLIIYSDLSFFKMFSPLIYL